MQSEIRRIFLIRHGETEGNQRRIIQGVSHETPLTERGQRQIHAAGQFLREQSGLPSCVIWTSSQSRAMICARMIADYVPSTLIVTCGSLTQRRWGSVEGQSLQTIVRIDGERIYLGRPGIELPPDAESLEEVRERLTGFTQMLLRFPGRDHVVVSHNEAINYLLDTWRGGALRHFAVYNGEIIEAHLDSHAHLQNLPCVVFPQRTVIFLTSGTKTLGVEGTAFLREHGYKIAHRTEEHVCERVQAVVVGDAPLSATHLEQYPNLRAVCRAGTGYNNVDVASFAARRIRVAVTKDVTGMSIPEWTLAMAIVMLRKWPQHHRGLRSSPMNWRAGGMGKEIGASTVGIFGGGHSGRMTAEIFAKNGARILLYNRSRRPELEALRVAYPDRIELVHDLSSALDLIPKRCDAVSIHLKYIPGTNDRLFGDAFFQRMFTHAGCRVFINTARGGLVDEGALLSALNSGLIDSAAIDVWQQEDSSNDETTEALRSHPNVIASPHIASLTAEWRERMGRQCAENVLALVEGRYSDVCDRLISPSAA